MNDKIITRFRGDGTQEEREKSPFGEPPKIERRKENGNRIAADRVVEELSQRLAEQLAINGETSMKNFVYEGNTGEVPPGTDSNEFRQQTVEAALKKLDPDKIKDAAMHRPTEVMAGMLLRVYGDDYLHQGKPN